MKFIGRIIPIVFFIIIGSFQITSANKICQNIVRKVVMKHCGGVPSTIVNVRAKRELEQPKVNIENFEPSADEIELSEYRYPVKRQLDAGAAAIASVARPVVTEIIQGAFNRRPYAPSIGARFQPAYQYAIPIAPSFPGASQYYVAAAAPPPAPGIYQSESILGKTLLPQANGEDLGFDVTSEEMDELYYEIANRLARNSGMNEKQREDLFKKTVAKCCPNEDLCYNELTAQKLINCA